MFDQKSTTSERKAFLEALLEEEGIEEEVRGHAITHVGEAVFSKLSCTCTCMYMYMYMHVHTCTETNI